MDPLERCPGCGIELGPYFDGWDCRACDWAMPDKQRKARGRIVSAEEIRKELGTPDEE